MIVGLSILFLANHMQRKGEKSHQLGINEFNQTLKRLWLNLSRLIPLSGLTECLFNQPVIDLLGS